MPRGYDAIGSTVDNPASHGTDTGIVRFDFAAHVKKGRVFRVTAAGGSYGSGRCAGGAEKVP
jgi:hypothetical protein